MFLGTMQMPASGETLALGDASLACARSRCAQSLPHKLTAIGLRAGTSWKDSSPTIWTRCKRPDHRLEQLQANDADDWAAKNEERELQTEREKIENSELQRLASCAPDCDVRPSARL